MTLFVPLSFSSPYNDYELRMALRSWEKYSPPARVVIIGAYPGWLQNVTHYEHGFANSKERNIHSKTAMMCKIEPAFTYSNDDFFLLEPFSGKNYADMPLIFKQQPSRYQLKIDATERAYPGGLFYDIHCPMEVDSAMYLKQPEWKEEQLIKSSYLNYAKTEATLIPDCKIVEPLSMHEIAERVKGRPFFSVGDNGINDSMRQYLETLFPDKSKYEK